MKPIVQFVVISIAAAIAGGAHSNAQCPGGQHHHAGNHVAGCYSAGCWMAGAPNASTNGQSAIVAIEGEITSVEKTPSTNSANAGVHLRVKTKTGALLVLLGPSWYLENQEMRLQAKDKIAITGLQVMWQAEPALIAAQVKKGDDVLVLRDGNGFPRWAGWRKRSADDPSNQ